MNDEYPAQYALIRVETGTVVWFENYQSAVEAHAQYGGSILNTATANPDLIKQLLDDARKNM